MRRETPAERRRRALAARRRNRWETEEVPPAHEDVMMWAEYRLHLVDNVEPAWRALFNYYTPFSAVEALHESGYSPEEARFILDTLKADRQKIYERPL